MNKNFQQRPVEDNDSSQSLSLSSSSIHRACGYSFSKDGDISPNTKNDQNEM